MVETFVYTAQYEIDRKSIRKCVIVALCTMDKISKKDRLNILVSKIIKQKSLYLILLPPLIIYIGFAYIPILKVRWALTNYGTVPLSQVGYIGLSNFEKLFSMSAFRQAFFNTLIINGYKLLFAFPVPIILALLINEIRKVNYKKFIQTTIFFPHFLSWVVVYAIWYMILAPQNSINAQVAEFFGVTPQYFFASTKFIRPLLVLTDIWKDAGYSTVVYLASLIAIDPSLYEAAIVDGAGKMKQIWYITLPCLRSTIVIMLILKVGKLLRIFEQVLIMASPVVREVTDVLDIYAYRTGIQQFQIGYAMAVTVFKAAVGLTLVLITNRISRKLGEEGVF